MLPTCDVIMYMRERANADDTINATFDDPVLLQAELDGLAVRDGGQWRGLGLIQVGERRTVRYTYGEPRTEIIIGTEEMRARLMEALS